MRIFNSIIFICCSLVFFNACKTEPDTKAIKEEVLNIHDQLMIDGEKLIKNKMKLDTLLLKLPKDSTVQKEQLSSLIKQLNAADEKMMDWMHFFNDNFKGKTEQEEINYYKSQMVSIRAVEDAFIKTIRTSDSVLHAKQIKPEIKQTQTPEKHH
ncbi:hypothetical protein ACJVDH_08880 [Pedobacter sp. AW1-32]|uniref:hypothetical protein n=1 Tax=Pedobacter sp. AW1-32 TaxID=3383026 RepID=UPI003FF0DD40